MRYNYKLIIESVCLTAGVCIAITLYAVTTTTDFTVCGPLLFIISIVFGIAGIFCWMFGPEMNLFYATLGVIVFSFYLLVDT
ncbi:MAG: Bax inhibitor-1 family protein [bacterium]